LQTRGSPNRMHAVWFVGVNFQMFAVNAILVNVEAVVEAGKSVLAAVGMVVSVAPTGGATRANPIAIFALVHGMVVMEEVLGLTLESRGLAQSRLLMNHLRQTCMYSSSQIMYGKSGLKLVGTG